MYELKPLHSPCKECVFAKYENNTQVDCHLGLINRYKEKNIEVIEAFDIDEKEFYIVNGKKCSGYKEEDYFTARGFADKTLQEKVDYIKSKFIVNYAAVIDIDKLSQKQFVKLLSCLKKAKIPPSQIIVIRNANDDKSGIGMIMKCLNNSGIKCPWRTETIIDPEEPYIITLHRITNNNRKNNFTFSISADFENIDLIVNAAQTLVYEDFQTFEVLTDKNQKNLFYNNLVYKLGIAHGVDILGEKERFTLI